MSARISSDLENGVVTITMDDPARNNPLVREDYLAMVDAFRAAREGDARCVVLEGAGDAFSAGYDIDAMDDTDDAASFHDHIAAIQAHEHALTREIRTHPLPTVAKVDGPAIGDAAGFAIACDVSLASERTRIGFSHVRFGLSLDCGVSYTLPRLVGEGLAMELALTGRIIDGEEAAAIGLVNHAFPTAAFEERADEIVDDIAAGPPVALKYIKQLIRDGHRADIESALSNEALRQAAVFETDDHRRAVEALQAGETPEFEGR